VEERRLLVFVRSPEKGRVKRRIAAALGDDAALALYRCFVADTLGLARQAACPFTVCFHPPEARPVVEAWLGPEVRAEPQMGKDLGERMYRALCKALDKARAVVLIGSDVPGLPPEMLFDAFAGLETHDAVIGPSMDGGYYLIGFTSEALLPAPFEGIGWGGPDVFRSTMDIFQEKKLTVQILPPWNDLDDYGDLEAFYASSTNEPEGRLRTVDFLRSLFRKA